MHGARRPHHRRAMWSKSERAAAGGMSRRTLIDSARKTLRACATVASVIEGSRCLCRNVPLCVTLSHHIPPYPGESHLEKVDEPHASFARARIVRPRTWTKDARDATQAATVVRIPGYSSPPPGRGPSFMNAFSTLAVTLEALLSHSLMGSAWPHAMELADHTAPSFGVVK